MGDIHIYRLEGQNKCSLSTSASGMHKKWHITDTPPSPHLPQIVSYVPTAASLQRSSFSNWLGSATSGFYLKSIKKVVAPQCPVMLP